MITILDVYFFISVAVFVVSGIMLLREARRNNFKMQPSKGAYNMILYYREIKSRHEKPSKRFWFFIVAGIHVVCITSVYVLAQGVGN